MRVHPRHALTPGEAGALRAWLAWRGRRGAVASMGMMAELPGVPMLPFAGGYLDQPEGLLRAFEIMEDAAAKTRAAQKSED